MAISSTDGGVVSEPTGSLEATDGAGALEPRRSEPGIAAAGEVAELGKLANLLARSGFFADARGGYQAFAKLLFGRDLGLSATAAMTGVHIVEGKPELSANIQAQMVRCYVGVGGERYDYRVISSKDERHERCEIEFYRTVDGRRETLGRSEFTIEDAERAGLTRPRRLGQPSNYAKFPPNMLFARAMSNGVAFHCPEVTRGIRVYHEGEIDATATALPAEDAAEMIPDAQIVSEAVQPDSGPTAGDGPGNGAEAVEHAAAPAQTDPDEEGNRVLTVDFGSVGPTAPEAA